MFTTKFGNASWMFEKFPKSYQNFQVQTAYLNYYVMSFKRKQIIFSSRSMYTWTYCNLWHGVGRIFTKAALALVGGRGEGGRGRFGINHRSAFLKFWNWSVALFLQFYLNVHKCTKTLTRARIYMTVKSHSIVSLKMWSFK